MVPFVLADNHEVRSVGADMDVGWTLCRQNKQLELRRRDERNLLIKGKLLSGSTACYRSSGRSLYTRVSCGDMTTYRPVTRAYEVNVGHIVFCELPPNNRFYAHLVSYKWWDTWTDKWKFSITNIDGYENGRCHIEHIYGLLINVEA